jgi:hypothetical protein
MNPLRANSELLAPPQVAAGGLQIISIPAHTMAE